MKRFFSTWYAKAIIIAVIAIIIYLSKDEFMKGYAEGKALRAKQRAEQAAKDSVGH